MWPSRAFRPMSLCAGHSWPRVRLLSCQPAPDGFGGGLGARRDAELVEDVLHPALDAGLAPAQLEADFVVAGACCQTAQHLDILFAQAHLGLDLRGAHLRELA